MNIFFYLFKEKENQRPEGLLNVQRISSNLGSNGSIPKRYQSVYTEGTPLTSFGIGNDDNQLRSHSVEIIFIIDFTFFRFSSSSSFL